MAVAGNSTVALLQEAGGTALVAVQGAVEVAHGPANVREALAADEFYNDGPLDLGVMLDQDMETLKALEPVSYTHLIWLFF